MADELSAPLVRRRDRAAQKRRDVLPGARRELPIARLAALAIVGVVSVLALRVFLVDDPNGGRPTTQVPINTTQNANPVAVQVAPTPEPAGASAVPAGPQVDVPIAGGPSFTTLADDLPGAQSGSIETLAASPGIVAALSEETDNGPVPRIGADGTTPFSAYSRPAPPSGGLPRIAVVVTGLGLSESGTFAALDKLPADVTLAFAPYGKSLGRTVGAAQVKGHELLLQVPLEPFDYPQNDPGPDTLLTGQPPRANLDKLLWLMGRFGGYVGVMNHMGARFTASGSDFAPVMEELATRGLGFLDDGSSNRSIAGQLAANHKVHYSRADAVLDDNPAREAILLALGKLEAKAKENGDAIGVISALPVSIDTIAEWSEGLSDRGIVLVPASALMQAGK